MMPRSALLRQPHMEILRDHPKLDAISDSELRDLEAFMRFCAEHRLGDPSGTDFQAFIRLRNLCPDTLPSLGGALRHLGVGEDLLEEIKTVHAAQAHKSSFLGITKGANRTFERRVSISVEEMPADWRKTLRRLHLEGEYSPSILERMKARLGMFVWSAQRVGRPIDLADTEALRALYNDMRERSITRQRARAKKQGLDDNIDTPRWAYLRSTWEELRRFARAHGLSEEVWDNLTRTYSVLVKKEGRQTAEKIVKAQAAGTRIELLKKAEAMLTKADSLPRPQMRHALRNRAAAIALGCAVPARPADVLAHHVFGSGITYEPARDAYRFRYKAGKTVGSTSADIDVPLLPWWNKFIDALILQDDDPRYLGHLRTKILSERRSLYVHYDGTPAVYSWYSRMWSVVAGTGGHIARTLIYDEAIERGAEGIQYGRVLNGHSPTSSVVQDYESERLAKARIQQSQDTLASLFGDDDDDE